MKNLKLVENKSNKAFICHRDQYGTEFYTKTETGETGMSIRGIARLCGLDEKSVRRYIAKRGSKLLIEKGNRCGSEALNNAEILHDETCNDIIMHYAIDAGRWMTKQARQALKKFNQAGLRLWIHNETGFAKQNTSQSLETSSDLVRDVNHINRETNKVVSMLPKTEGSVLASHNTVQHNIQQTNKVGKLAQDNRNSLIQQSKELAELKEMVMKIHVKMDQIINNQPEDNDFF